MVDHRIVFSDTFAARDNARSTWLHRSWGRLVGRLGARRSRLDLLIVVASTTIVTLWSQRYHPADRFFFWSSTHWTQEYFDLDEAPIFLLWLALALIWFAWRRSRDRAREAGLRGQELVLRWRAEEALHIANEELESRVEARVRELERETGQRVAAEAAAGRLQAQIAHMNRVAALDLMTVSLAHELSHPCFAIKNYLNGICERLRSGDFAAAELLRAVDHAIEQTERAGAIIQRFREFARPAEPQMQRVDVAELLRESGRMMAPLAEGSGITLEVEIAEPIPAVRGDPLQLEQVIVNLALNAIEAMSAPGPAARRLTIGGRRVEGHEATVEIFVADTGPGIAPKLAGRLFEPFVTTKEEGAGMGLAICRAIVEAHDGTIRPDGNADNGTTFVVALPLAPA